jgi:hypothetical protein
MKWNYIVIHMSNEVSNISVHLPSFIEMESKQYHKIMFIQNALNRGWTIKKRQNSYIFTKRHDNLREIFQESYLDKFIQSNSTESTFV